MLYRATILSLLHHVMQTATNMYNIPVKFPANMVWIIIATFKHLSLFELENCNHLILLMCFIVDMTC